MLQKENQNQSTLDVNEVRRGRAIATEAEAAVTEQNCSTTEALIQVSSATKKVLVKLKASSLQLNQNCFSRPIFLTSLRDSNVKWSGTVVLGDLS